MHVDDGENRLGELLLRLAKRARVRQVGRLAPLGLTPAQARALGAIGRFEQPPRMAELAELLGVVPRAVTPIVDALEEAGLVTRQVDPGNRRATLLVLTGSGKRMRTRLHQARAGAAEDLFACLTEAEQATLQTLLEKVYEQTRGEHGPRHHGRSRESLPAGEAPVL
ncbi:MULTISPECIES: MarR family winged helix-turn-helix transcriptional regulator [Prauserella]|uniref:MarR family winged helix-turn-helix transcriptional regulator n=1 Tax=Prauserella TaxID=142577 RepID=UPI000D82858B|nr:MULTISPECIES: MarR family transcriptional regulator [Prauserella]PXY34565.1 hypothetical protein BAY59_03325 [Prauserella coralliicola]